MAYIKRESDECSLDSARFLNMKTILSKMYGIELTFDKKLEKKLF